MEILADKAAQVEKRTKANTERASIEEAGHSFQY